jgi:hypothetical protein
MFLREKSILDFSEGELVARLLSPDWHSRIVDIAGMPLHPVHFQEVSLSGVPHEEDRGDVDILLYNSERPWHSVAIEVKRVKFSSEAIATLRPNKVHELAKGVEQANRLARIGFSQVYFYAFVMVDSRAQNAGQNTYAGTSMEAKELIRRVTDEAYYELDRRVGMYCCEFTQPQDFAPLGAGGFHGNLRRLAQAVEQRAELTEWVAKTPQREQKPPASLARN